MADDFSKGTTIPPGKRAIGSYYAEAPKDVKVIELRVKEDYFSKQYATFIFDVPPVEESNYSFSLDDFLVSPS